MKIIGKIVGVQNARDGVNSLGHEWHQRDYVVEDETHPGEGVVVTTFSLSVMQQVGKQTHGELTVEVDYAPKIRYWDGIRKDGTRGEARWNQTLDLVSMKILKGTPANQAQTEAAPQPTAPAAPQPSPLPPNTLEALGIQNDLPF